jgi:hypothetical protein
MKDIPYLCRAFDRIRHSRNPIYSNPNDLYTDPYPSLSPSFQSKRPLSLRFPQGVHHGRFFWMLIIDFSRQTVPCKLPVYPAGYRPHLPWYTRVDMSPWGGGLLC